MDETEQTERKRVFIERYQRFLEEVSHEMGVPVLGAFIMVHVGTSRIFDIRVSPNAAPQSRMNMLDDMVEPIGKIASAYKADINTKRLEKAH